MPQPTQWRVISEAIFTTNHWTETDKTIQLTKIDKSITQ